jgi:hypothetical protein
MKAAQAGEARRRRPARIPSSTAAAQAGNSGIAADEILPLICRRFVRISAGCSPRH